MTSCLSGPFFRRSSSNLRPFKLQNAENNCRVGVVAESVASLKKQASSKFKVDLKDLRLVLEEDGTEVDSDEYLEILPQQAVLVAVSKGRDWKPAHNHLKEVLSSFENANKLGPLKLAVEELLSKKEHRPQILRLIGEISGSIEADSKAHLETDQEDPDWFLNVGRCFRTKDQYMRENARRRIRGYLRMSSDYVKRHKILAARHRHEIESIFRWFADELLENDEFSDYFARSSDNEEVRMCDGEGWFRCEGLYDSDRCGFEHHRINPYASQHHRVLFSTWNLDHGIERSREVLPRLIEAISRKSGRTVNARYFFDLMFTRCNLKLVHIECHDKTQHSAKCDPQNIYLPD